MGRAFTGALLVLLLLAAPAAAEPVGVELTVAQEDTRTTAVAAAEYDRGLVAYSTRTAYGAVPLGRDIALDRPAQPILGDFPAAEAGQVLALAANPDRKEHLLVWPEGGQVKARRLTALGAPLGPPSFDVAPLATRPSPPDNIAVAYSPDSQDYLVVWSTGTTIEARRVTNTGELRGGVIVLSDVPDYTQAVAPHVAPGSQGWLVAWTGIRANGQTDVIVQALDRSAGQRGSERRIASGATPSIAADPAGDAVVAFTEGDRVRAQRLNAAGDPRGDNLEIARDARAPEIAWSPVGKRYLVVYRAASDRIRGRLLDDEAKVQGTEELEIGFEAAARDPAVAALPSGDDFLVAWGAAERGYARWVESLPGSAGTGTGTEYPYYDPYAPYDPNMPYDPYAPYEPYPFGDTPYVYEPYPYEPIPDSRPTEEPSAADDAGGVGLSLLGTPSLRGLVGRGLLTRATCVSGCTARMTLTVDARTARRHRVPTTLARASRRLRAGGATTAALRPRLSVRRRLRGVERLRVTVTLAVESADTGATERRRRSVTLTR